MHRGAASREVFPGRLWLPVSAILAVPNSLFRRRERANLSSWHRCVWPRPVFETPFRRPGVAACWTPGRGDHTTHRLVRRCGGGLLRWVERQPSHARRRPFSCPPSVFLALPPPSLPSPP